MGDTEVAAFVPAGEPVPDTGSEAAIRFDPRALHVMGAA
jgi:hypothetical protein